MTDQQGTEYLKVSDVRKQLGISQKRMSDLMKNGTFTVYESERDARVKLIPREQVEAYARRLGTVRPKSSTSTTNDSAA